LSGARDCEDTAQTGGKSQTDISAAQRQKLYYKCE
jgi:hypothetical protein